MDGEVEVWELGKTGEKILVYTSVPSLPLQLQVNIAFKVSTIVYGWSQCRGQAPPPQQQQQQILPFLLP
jgi:hypothetical protein